MKKVCYKSGYLYYKRDGKLYRMPYSEDNTKLLESKGYSTKSMLTLGGKLNRTLYHYQLTSVIEAAKHNWNLLIADVMGAGKSSSAIACHVASGSKKTLIIVPSNIKLQWKRNLQNEIKRCPHVKVCNSTTYERSDLLEMSKSRITIINYDIVNAWMEPLCEFQWDMMILDESQKIKADNSARTHAVFEIRKHVKSCICLSGTPLTDRNADIYNTIKKLDLDSTMKIKGLSSGRADIFPSALAEMKAVLSRFEFSKITISGCGLREGAMFRYAVPSVNERPLSDVLGHSLYTQMRYFDINIAHAEHVYNLSIQLFKQLKVLHKMSRMYVRVLKIAALLHDSGMRIKYYNHQLHSSYIILNSNLYGVPHKDIIVASFVASGHRKVEFAKEDLIKYKDILTAEDVEAIKKLSVILRIAESFDRSMSGVVTGISCDVLGDSVIVKTETEDGRDCSLEVKDAMSAAADFKAVFGKNLEIL